MALVLAVLSNLFPQFTIFSVYIEAFSRFGNSNFLYPIKGHDVSWILQIEILSVNHSILSFQTYSFQSKALVASRDFRPVPR